MPLDDIFLHAYISIAFLFQEDLMLKEHVEVLMQKNSILKRAVAFQHERQKEFEDKHRELQQLVSQYQQQLKTLQVRIKTFINLFP